MFYYTCITLDLIITVYQNVCGLRIMYVGLFTLCIISAVYGLKRKNDLITTVLMVLRWQISFCLELGILVYW